MTAAFLRIDTLPRCPSRARAVTIMAALGVLTGLISSLPSPLPDLQLSEPEILISARTIPIHAGVAFGAMLGGMLFLWVNRHPGKCALAMVLTLLGWLVAVNTANDVTSAVLNSELFGTVPGAKADREILGWLLAGLCAGAVGAGLTAFGAGIPAAALRRPQAWVPIVAVGAVFGLLLYPAGELDMVPLLFVPWQAVVAATIAYGLTLPKT
jgi:hypothetical protein